MSTSWQWVKANPDEAARQIRHLERENAALRQDVYLCPPTSEHDYEGFKWCDAFDEIEGDNSKLHNEVTALKHENLSLREARKPVAVPGLHGVVTWYADAQQLGEAFQREREKCLRFEEVMQSQGDEIRRLMVENDALRKDKERMDWLEAKQYEVWFFVGADPSPVFSALTLRAAIDAAKEAKP